MRPWILFICLSCFSGWLWVVITNSQRLVSPVTHQEVTLLLPLPPSERKWEQTTLVLSVHETPNSPAILTWPNKEFENQKDTVQFVDDVDSVVALRTPSGRAVWRVRPDPKDIIVDESSNSARHYVRVSMPVHLFEKHRIRKTAHIRYKFLSRPELFGLQYPFTGQVSLGSSLLLPPVSALDPAESAPIASQICGVLAGFALTIAAVLLERRGDTKSSAAKKKDPYLYQASIAVFVLSFTACSLASCVYLLPKGGSVNPSGAFLFHALASAPFAIGAVLLFLGVYLALAASTQKVELMSSYWAYVLATLFALFSLLRQNTSAITEASWSGHAFVLSHAEWGCFGLVLLFLTGQLLFGYFRFRFDVVRGVAQRVSWRHMKFTRSISPKLLAGSRVGALVLFAILAGVSAGWNALDQVSYSALDVAGNQHLNSPANYVRFPMEAEAYVLQALRLFVLSAALWLLLYCWHPPHQAGGGSSTNMLSRVTVFAVVTLLALLLISLCVAYFWYHNGDLSSSHASILGRALLCLYYTPSLIIGGAVCLLVPPPWLIADNQLSLDSLRVTSPAPLSWMTPAITCQWISNGSDAGDMFVLLYKDAFLSRPGPRLAELSDRSVKDVLENNQVVAIIVIDHQDTAPASSGETVFDGKNLHKGKRSNGWMYQSIEHEDARLIVQHFGRTEGAVLCPGDPMAGTQSMLVSRHCASLFGDEYIQVNLGPGFGHMQGKWRLLHYDQETHDFSLGPYRRLPR